MAITIPILTDFDGRGIDRGIKQFGQLEGAGKKAGFLIRKAAIPAAAALGALGAGAFVAAKAAAEDAAAADKLANQLSRVTTANKAALDAVEPYISALSQEVGVADDDLRPALGKLATATGDLTGAQKLLGTALDVSAQTGKPLESVTTALAKAYGGNFTALNRLIPGFDQGIIKSKDFAKAQKELARLTGGAAAESANTAQGQFQRLGIALQETKESIGAALLPVLEAFLPMLQAVGRWAQENSRLIVILGATFGGLAVAILAARAGMAAYEAISVIAKAATVAFTAAQWLLNVALTANPIGIVIAALAALAGAIYLAWEKSGTFREIVLSVWEAIKPVAAFIGNVFVAAWRVLKFEIDLVVTVVGALIDAVATVWQGLKAFGGWVADRARALFGGLATAAEIAIAPILAIVNAIKWIARNVNKLNPFGREIPERIKQDWAALSATFGQNEIPHMAHGGIVTQPTVALIGEAGPEAVIPLGKRGAMGITINMHAGLVSTPDQIGQQIIEAIQRAERRSGPAFMPA